MIKMSHGGPACDSTTTGGTRLSNGPKMMVGPEPHHFPWTSANMAICHTAPFVNYMRPIGSGEDAVIAGVSVFNSF